MLVALEEQGVNINESTYRKQTTIAFKNNCVALSLQKTSGQALPSHIDRSIALTVKALRENKFLVFPDDVMKWAAEKIRGTIHETYFPDGISTRGWYRRWLGRMEFLTRPLRPLEQTRDKWDT
jgi:hypothetical protein